MKYIKKRAVFKIQWGVNPNSSSIGIMLFAVPSVLFFAGLLFPLVITTILIKFKKKTKKERDDW